MELLVTCLIFVLILVALFYLIRLIPDATLQTVAKVVVVVGALIWLITHVRLLIHALAG